MRKPENFPGLLSDYDSVRKSIEEAERLGLGIPEQNHSSIMMDDESFNRFNAAYGGLPLPKYDEEPVYYMKPVPVDSITASGSPGQFFGQYIPQSEEETRPPYERATCLCGICGAYWRCECNPQT